MRRLAVFLFHEFPELGVSLALIAALIVFISGVCWMGAKAQARMYEQATGLKVDPVDIFWGGSPPSMDVRIRQGDKP